MTYNELLNILIKVTNSIEANKGYINELDEKLGDGTFGSKLVQVLKKALDQIHKLDTKELGVVFKFLSKVFSAFGGTIGKVYSQTLAEFSTIFTNKSELTLTDIIMMVDFIINKLTQKESHKESREHLKFWQEFKGSIVKEQNTNKPVTLAVKSTLKELQWAYPATRSNSQSLVRVLIIRTLLKNL